MLRELKEASEAVGLRMNLMKTKIMSPNDIQVTVDNHTLEVVENYVYLGHNINLGRENQTAEITRSIGLLSWDLNDCLVDLEKELAIITEQALEGEEARYGERLIQFASENLVTEILIHPVVSTLAQCMRNLLSSFTRHRHIIHAGYTFAANGSWALQDGTFSSADFAEAFQELEVQRVIRAYENGISLDLHCSPEGDWNRLPKEQFAKSCKVRVNPTDVLTSGSPSITGFINYISPFLLSTSLENLLESSDVVGNIRFSRPTLYVFPGGQGDAALFGINGFNMLLDGGFSRKACFWDFVRHLDRLDAVLMTRLNNSNVGGISSVLRRKKQDAVYPQIGHFFCNIQERKALLSPDGDKDKDPLLINLMDEGQEIISNLRHLNLNPQVCYRDSEPINLYHKVGHGTLDMYVLSPAKDSKEVREFLQKWNQSDQKLFANSKSSREFSFPIQNLISIAALLVWQPANPNDTITRILFPGSSPQRKIFEGLDRLKNLEFIKHPVCTDKSLVPSSLVKRAAKDSIIEKVIAKEKVPVEKKENKIIENNLSQNGDVKEKIVKKSDSTESERSTRTKKTEDKIIENGEKPKAKPKPSKARSETQQKRKPIEKKSSPTTPKKTVENGEAKKPTKPSPIGTPAKSTKDANNRKVIESKTRAAKPPPAEPKPKIERKPISRRPKGSMKAPISPVKKLVNGVQKPDSISKKGKLDKEGTTDSSTVSTPSADQESLLKKDISKLTPDELQQMKAQELADLKEEQEAVKEIEAVFRKGETKPEKDENLRKVKEISIDEDKLEKEEYLIIEKEEIDHDSLDEKEPKEDETQKLARDSEESEKQRKLSTEEQVIEKQQDIEEQVNDIVNEAEDIVKAKEDTAEASKEGVITSPEEKLDVSSTDKKTTDKEIEEEVKDVVESQPDEKVSVIKSGDTTTAPTLPEDERIPLDEIKEDSGQIIEEKHVKEETKEKEVPVIQLPPKTFDPISKVPGVVGIRLDKQSHIRDIVKTPDEVADLPVHEEVDYEYTHELKADTKTNEIVEEKKDDKVDDNVHQFIRESEETAGYIKEQAKEIEQEKDKDEVMQEELKDIIEHVDKTIELHEDLKILTDAVIESEAPLEKDTEKPVQLKETMSPAEQDKLDEQSKKTVQQVLDEEKQETPKEISNAHREQHMDSQQLQTEDILEKAELETKEKIDIKDAAGKEEPKEEKGIIEKEETEKDKLDVTESEEKESKKVDDTKETIQEKEDIKETELMKTEGHEKPQEVKEKDVTKDESPKESLKTEESTTTSSEDKGGSEDKIDEEKVDAKEKLEEKVAVDKEDLKEETDDLKNIDEKVEHKKQELQEEPLVNGEVLDEEEINELDKRDSREDTPDKHSKLEKMDDYKDVEHIETAKKVDDIDDVEKQTELKSDASHVELMRGPSVEEVKTELTKQNQEIIRATKEDKVQLEKIDEKLQQLKEKSPEPTIEVIDPKKLEDLPKSEPSQLVKSAKDGKDQLEKLEEKLLELKQAEDDKFKLKPDPDTIVEEDDKDQKLTGDIIEKMKLGRKSPKEREEDVIKIVASVAEVLKSDAPLEEFEGKLPISTVSPYTTTYTTELRETHITTVDSPIVESKVIKMDDIPPIPEEPATLEEEKVPVSDKEAKRSSLLKESQELMMATSKMISEIKSGKGEEKEETDESGVVHRMLVTTSSEDGGEEIEICPAGTITFSKSSESSGRSSPEKSQEVSKKSSIVDTMSDSLSTVKQVVELHSEKDSGIDDVKSDTDLESQEKLSPPPEAETKKETRSMSPHEKSEEIMSQTVSGKSSPDKDASIKSLASGKSTPDMSDLEKSKEITSSLDDLKKPDLLGKDAGVEGEVLSNEILKAESKAQQEAKETESIKDKVEETEKIVSEKPAKSEALPEVPQKIEEESAKEPRKDSLIEKIEDTSKDQFDTVSDFTKSLFSKGEKEIKMATTDIEEKVTELKEEGKAVISETVEKGDKTVEDLKATEDSFVEQIEDKIKDTFEAISTTLPSFLDHDDKKSVDSTTALTHAEDVKEVAAAQKVTQKSAETHEDHLEDRTKAVSAAMKEAQDSLDAKTDVTTDKSEETPKGTDSDATKIQDQKVADLGATSEDTDDAISGIFKKSEADLMHTVKVDKDKTADTTEKVDKKDAVSTIVSKEPALVDASRESDSTGEIKKPEHLKEEKSDDILKADTGISTDKVTETTKDSANDDVPETKDAIDTLKEPAKAATDDFDKALPDVIKTDKDTSETVASDILDTDIKKTDTKPSKDGVTDKIEEHTKPITDTLDKKSLIPEKDIADDKPVTKDSVTEKEEEIVKSTAVTLDAAPDILEKDVKDKISDKVDLGKASDTLEKEDITAKDEKLEDTSKDADVQHAKKDVKPADDDSKVEQLGKPDLSEDKTVKRKESIVDQLEEGVKSTFSAIAGFGKSLFDKGDKVIEDTAPKVEHIVDDLKTTTESLVDEIEEDVKGSMSTVQDFQKSLLESDDKTAKEDDVKKDPIEDSKFDGTTDKRDVADVTKMDITKPLESQKDPKDGKDAKSLALPEKSTPEDKKDEEHSVVKETEPKLPSPIKERKDSLEDIKIVDENIKEQKPSTEERADETGELTLEKQQKDETVIAKDVSKEDKSSIPDVKSVDLLANIPTEVKEDQPKEVKHSVDSKSPTATDLSGRTTPELKVDPKDEKSNEYEQAEPAEKKVVGSESPVKSEKSTPDIKTDKDEKESELAHEKEIVQSLQKDPAADTDLKDLKTDEKIGIKEDVKEKVQSEGKEPKSKIESEVQDAQSTEVLTAHDSDLPEPKEITKDLFEKDADKSPKLSGKSSPDLEKKEDVRKLSVPELKETTKDPLSEKDDARSATLLGKSSPDIETKEVDVPKSCVSESKEVTKDLLPERDDRSPKLSGKSSPDIGTKEADVQKSSVSEPKELTKDLLPEKDERSPKLSGKSSPDLETKEADIRKLSVSELKETSNEVTKDLLCEKGDDKSPKLSGKSSPDIETKEADEQKSSVSQPKEVTKDLLPEKDERSPKLSGKSSPDLETKEADIRKLSVSELKETSEEVTKDLLCEKDDEKSPKLSGKSSPDIETKEADVQKISEPKDVTKDLLPEKHERSPKLSGKSSPDLETNEADIRKLSLSELKVTSKEFTKGLLSEKDDVGSPKLSGKNSPDLETKEADVRKLSVSELKEAKSPSPSGKSTPEVKDLDEPTERKESKSPTNVISTKQDTELGTLGKVTPEKSISKTVDDTDDKKTADVSKKDAVSVSSDAKDVISDSKKDTGDSSKDTKDDDLKKSANVITDATFTTTDAKPHLSKRDERESTPLSDLTRAVEDEKLLEKEEKILEKSADDLRQTFEIVSDMAESVLSDKCEKLSSEIETMDEKSQKQAAESLGKSADDIREAFEAVSDMSKSVVFEKCDKHPAEVETMDEKLLKKEEEKLAEELEHPLDMSKSLTFDKCGISTDIEEIDPKLMEKEQIDLKKSVETLKEAYDTVTTLSKSLSSEKLEDKSLQKEAKELEDRAEELKDTFDALTDMSKSVVFEKCRTDEMGANLEKEETAIEKSAESLKDAYDTVTKLSKSLSFEKCEKPEDKLLAKEARELEDRAEGLKESFETLTDMSKSVVFEKCHTDEIDPKRLEKEETAIEKSAESLKDAYDTVTKLSKSLSFEKCDKSEDKKETVTDLSESVVVEKEKKSLADELLEKSAQDKCDKDDHKEKSDSEKELYDEKSSKNLHAEDSVVKDIVEKVAADIDTKSISSEIKSPKDLPGPVESPLKATASDIKDVIDAATADIDTKSIQAEFRKSPELLAQDNKLQKSPESVTPETVPDSTAVFEKCEKETMEKVSSAVELKEEAKPVVGKEPKDLDSKETLPSLEKEIIKDEAQPVDSRLGGKDIVEPKSTLNIVQSEVKKLSISDVEISLADVEVGTDLASTCPKDTSSKLIEAERRLSSDRKSEKGDIKDDKQKTERKDTEDSCDKAKESIVSEKIPASVAGPSTLERTKDSDATELEKQQELQDTLHHEKHIPGAVTPPTVPVSPNIIESYSDDIKLTSRTETLIREMGLRSSTPGSDDFEIVTSTQSDISSGQVSKVPLDSEKFDSDEEDQLSVTSQVAHSRDSSHYDLDEDVKVSARIDPMSMSFYGALPGDDAAELSEKPAEPTYLYEITKAKFAVGGSGDEADVKLDQINKNGQAEGERLMTASFIGELPTSSGADKKDPIESWGKPLGRPAVNTYLYEITKARTSAQSLRMSEMEKKALCQEEVRRQKMDYSTKWAEAKNSGSLSEDKADPDHISQNEQDQNVMTASFYGDSQASFWDDKDPIASWGKPLGLPSPAPPVDNKGTPKKERKLPPNVTAKNKLNDDKKRAESPSKYRNKKVSPVYVDLTYVPHHGNAYYSYVDFFKRIRARYYVFSGIEPSRDVYNALLEAKQTWDDKELEVTIIPTYDTDILGYWVAENEELLTKYKIDLSPSASRCTINLQDHETSCSAYRLEF